MWCQKTLVRAKLGDCGAGVGQRIYIGQEYDPATGLNYLNARYQSPTKANFISQDPVFWEIGQSADGKAALMNPQAQNSYSYAGGNPIVNKDPTGRAFGIDDAAGFVVGGLIGVTSKGIVDMALGQRATWGQTVESFVTGGIIGVGAVNTPETLGASNAISASIVSGLIGGFYGNLAGQGIDMATGNQIGGIDFIQAPRRDCWQLPMYKIAKLLEISHIPAQDK